jgi:hypothetical protein
METVSEEFVEQYGEFFIRLSDAQLKERIAEFGKKQPVIINSINGSAQSFNSSFLADFVWRITLLLLYCFESDENKVPVVSLEDVNEYAKYYLNGCKEPIPEAAEDTFLYKETIEINQPCFYNWIDKKLHQMEYDEKLIDFKQGSSIYQVMIITGQLIHRKLTK